MRLTAKLKRRRFLSLNLLKNCGLIKISAGQLLILVKRAREPAFVCCQVDF